MMTGFSPTLTATYHMTASCRSWHDMAHNDNLLSLSLWSLPWQLVHPDDCNHVISKVQNALVYGEAPQVCPPPLIMMDSHPTDG